MPSDSVAKTAGVKSGDRIVEVDGHKITDWQDLTVQIRSKANKNISVKVDRDGQDKTLSMKPKAQTSGGQTSGFIGITQTMDKSFKAKILPVLP